MKLNLPIRLNDKLYIKDPAMSELGRKIIQSAILLIDKLGLESFTFKKLAEEIGTTEASVYRYFENKHRLLVYLVTWYWSWLEFNISYAIKNEQEPIKKLKSIIHLLSTTVSDDDRVLFVNESILHKVVIAEGAKAYLNKHVAADNKDQLFHPYKQLCSQISGVILEINPTYPYARSLSSTIVEMAHLQYYFMHHLPSLTDFGKTKDEQQIVAFIESFVFAAIKKD